MGEGNRLDGSSGYQYASGIYWAGGYLAESISSMFSSSYLHNFSPTVVRHNDILSSTI